MERPACYSQEYASAFGEASVVDAYAFRPPYPPQVFDVLARLLPAHPQRILDVGCGTGALARHLTRSGSKHVALLLFGRALFRKAAVATS